MKKLEKRFLAIVLCLIMVFSSVGSVNAASYKRICRHSKRWYVVKEATCKKTGLKVQKCRKCNKKFKEKTISRDYSNHDYINLVVQHEGTYKKCKDCGFMPVPMPSKPSKPSKPLKPIVSKPSRPSRPSTSKPSRPSRPSSTTPSRPSRPSRPSSTTPSRPTCCEVCNSTDIRKSYTASTCSKKGSIRTYCFKCDFIFESETEYLEKNPNKHEHTEYVLVKPTCTSKGYETTRCKDCRAEVGVRNTLAALDHDFRNGKCKYCGFKESLSNPDIRPEKPGNCSHIHVKYSSKEPTCTKTGIEEQICKDCGVVVFRRVIPAKAHNLVLLEVIRQPSKYSYGLEKMKCVHCNKTKINKIPKLH